MDSNKAFENLKKRRDHESKLHISRSLIPKRPVKEQQKEEFTIQDPLLANTAEKYFSTILLTVSSR